MKITITPTEASNEEHPNRWMHSTVSIDHPKDEQTIDEVIELLVIPALVAWGFHEASIDKALESSRANSSSEQWRDRDDTESKVK